MSRLRSLAIKTPIHTILRLKEADRGRQNIMYRNEILTVLDPTGKTLDEIKVKNAVYSSTSMDRILKQQLTPFIEQVTKGYNLLFMSLGTTGSGKDSLFGMMKNRGLISLLVEQLCMECESNYYATTHQNLEFFFQIRAIEIFEERVMDLFNSNLPTSCTMRDNVWEGVVLERSTAVKAENYLDFMEKLQLAYKNRQNLLNVISGSTAKTSSIITVSLIQEFKEKGKRATLCSKIMFAEPPGLEILKDSQLNLRVREANKAIRGIVAFSSLIKQLADDNNQVSPLYEVSNLTYALKQFLGSNSLCVAFANVINQDPQGALKTLACMKNLVKISQYPIVNTGESLGLMYRMRTDVVSLKIPEVRERMSEKMIKEEKLMNQNSNQQRVKAEDDYKRILEKYRDSKTKLEEAVRKKSELQLLLIRSQQQKLELSKTLVEVQIQNTKLMEDAQFKEYNLSKKNHKLESALLKNESEKTRSIQNITDMNQYVAQLEQDKRDLEIQFIALKKNYLLSQKQLEESRKQTQTIQVDYINLTNENKYLQDQLFRGTRDEREKYQMEQINKYHQDKSEWMRKENQYKRQIDQLRKELLRNSKQSGGVRNMPSSSKVSDKSNNVELENQRLELYNRLKLSERKVGQLEEHLRILNEDIEEYKQQNSTLTQSLNTTAGYYKNKLEQLMRNKDGVMISKAMNDHLIKQNDESGKRIAQLGRKSQSLKQKNRGLRIYALRLKGLAEEYMPRGLELPVHQQSDDIDEIEQEQIFRLNEKIRELQNQLRMRSRQQNSRQKESITNEMLKEQINFLKQSRVGTPASHADKLRKEHNELKEENRKLTMMLKDSNKLQIASILKQNETLKSEIDRMKSKDSVSPVSNDQKLVYYEKHIKKLQKQRSELIVRVTMAEEQLKMYQNHYEKKRG